MLYRLKNTDTISVFEMVEAGAINWKRGDMVLIKDGVPKVIDRAVLDIFLEPVGPNAPPPAPPPPPPPEPPKQPPMVIPPKGPKKHRFPARGYKRKHAARSKVTNWIVDGLNPIQVMEGRILVAMQRLIDAPNSSIQLAEFFKRLPSVDAKGASARVRELNQKGYIDVVLIDERRHIALRPLALKALQLYGDQMRAAQPPVPKVPNVG
jgi:hypothetical protein